MISSYDLVRKISSVKISEAELSLLGVPQLTTTFQSYLFEVIVADEAHVLRNPLTETSNSIFSLKVCNIHKDYKKNSNL